MSKSTGGSCVPSKFSRPYVMCSRIDAPSTAIDFSKGSVDDGVVDSPPSRGPVRTPVCSPLPLKRAESLPVRRRSLSPTPRTETTPHRKLYGSFDGDRVDPRPEEEVLSPTVLARPRVQKNVTPTLLPGDCRKKARMGSTVAMQIGRFKDNGNFFGHLVGVVICLLLALFCVLRTFAMSGGPRILNPWGPDTLTYALWMECTQGRVLRLLDLFQAPSCLLGLDRKGLLDTKISLED